MDNCILAAKITQLEVAVAELACKFEITDEGGVDGYLGVKVEHES